MILLCLQTLEVTLYNLIYKDKIHHHRKNSLRCFLLRAHNLLVLMQKCTIFFHDKYLKDFMGQNYGAQLIKEKTTCQLFMGEGTILQVFQTQHCNRAGLEF